MKKTIALATTGFLVVASIFILGVVKNHLANEVPILGPSSTNVANEVPILGANTTKA